MIRNVEDITRVIDLRFGAAALTPTSLLRVAGWMIVGMLLIGVVWPASPVDLAKSPDNKGFSNTYVRSVSMDSNDPRGFAPVEHEDGFTIAWIGGSTLRTSPSGLDEYVAADYIPLQVQRFIPRLQGKPVYIDMYYMASARTFDLYAAAQAALSTSPDLLVMGLNPLWLFNEKTIQRRSNLDEGLAASDVLDVGSWPIRSALLSPSDLVLGTAARGLPAVRDRWSYAQDFQGPLDRLSPLDRSSPPAPGPLSELDEVAAFIAPLQFWAGYPKRPAQTEPTQNERDLGNLQYAYAGRSKFSDAVVGRIFSAIEASGVPTYVYLDAISQDQLQEPRIDAQLRLIEDHLQSIADQYQGVNLTVRSKSAARRLPPMQFADRYHLANARVFAPYLADELCERLRASDIDCTPEKTGNP